ncbi:MAG: VOC family protein [Myxococcota bacterium]
MRLGAFSLSLAVKDLSRSKDFYLKLGFEVVGGNEEHNWLIVRNGESTLGLFQGMFEKNTLTFNPGWDSTGADLESYDDVRDLQKQIEAAGLSLTDTLDGNSTGPAHIALVDPDGNPVLIDQHR